MYNLNQIRAEYHHLSTYITSKITFKAYVKENFTPVWDLNGLIGYTRGAV